MQGERTELTCVLNDDSMSKGALAMSLIKTYVLNGEELTFWKPSPSAHGFSMIQELLGLKCTPFR